MKITRKNHNFRWNEEILFRVIAPDAKKYGVARYCEILALEARLRRYGHDESVKALINKIKNENK